MDSLLSKKLIYFRLLALLLWLAGPLLSQEYNLVAWVNPGNVYAGNTLTIHIKTVFRPSTGAHVYFEAVTSNDPDVIARINCGDYNPNCWKSGSRQFQWNTEDSVSFYI